MGAYILDEETMEFLINLEKNKLNKPHPIVYSKEEALELHKQQINSNAWFSYIYKGIFHE